VLFEKVEEEETTRQEESPPDSSAHNEVKPNLYVFPCTAKNGKSIITVV